MNYLSLHGKSPKVSHLFCSTKHYSNSDQHHNFNTFKHICLHGLETSKFTITFSIATVPCYPYPATVLS